MDNGALYMGGDISKLTINSHVPTVFEANGRVLIALYAYHGVYINNFHQYPASVVTSSSRGGIVYGTPEFSASVHIVGGNLNMASSGGLFSVFASRYVGYYPRDFAFYSPYQAVYGANCQMADKTFRHGDLDVYTLTGALSS